MYLDSIISGYKLIKVPVNKELRDRLEHRTMEDLIEILSSYKDIHNKTDIDTRKRAIRAIEIAEYYRDNAGSEDEFPG